MESQNQQQPKQADKKTSWKDWVAFIVGIGLLVSIKPIIRAVMSNSSSGYSSSSSSVQIDLDLPESEPIDFGALVDEAFEESAATSDISAEEVE